MTKDFHSIRQETQALWEAAQLVREGKTMHHYAAGMDAEQDDKGNYHKDDTAFLKKAGESAKKAGMKVSYSTGGTNHSSTINSKHDMVHISHHDDQKIRKHLVKHEFGDDHHPDDDAMNDLRSKTHGGHSAATADYHRTGAGAS